ncbi:CBS domain-containing protein [Fredinandcohnia sp. 179-A 10B2 NHS]|uniref:CBS domain-containing protein n=1 Tax=Fredinandcohnia sp. 179-A 10B2 NHS TaxID=3235176 RepID=UPI0039A362DD
MIINIDKNLSERFEVAFNQIHEVLKKKVKAHTTSFTELVRIGAPHHQVIKKYSDDLLQYAKLRNAMVHEKTDIGFYIAEPHENVVNRLEKISNLFNNHNYVLTIATKEPITYNAEDTIQDVILGMKNHGYSQYPIYEGKECIGLLRNSDIINWLSTNMASHIVDLENIKVKDIFACESMNHPISFAPKSYTIFEIEDVFEKYHQEKKDLEMVIITENGLKNETPLGIVTAWDLIEIDYTTD